jgi:hypothetical protein
MLRSGVLGAAGLAMIIPLFVPSRWWARRTSMPEAAEASEFLSGLTQGTGPQAPAEPASYPEQEDEACQPRPAGSPRRPGAGHASSRSASHPSLSQAG